MYIILAQRATGARGIERKDSLPRGEDVGEGSLGERACSDRWA